MKNILMKFLFLLILIPTLSSAELKVGYVVVEKVLKEAPQTALSNKKLEKEFKARSEKLKKQMQGLQSKEKSYTKNSIEMSKSDRKVALKNLQSAKIDIQRVERELREDVDLRRREEIGKLQIKINKAVEKVAKTQGYDLILYQGVAFANDKVDITDNIIKVLSERATN